MNANSIQIFKNDLFGEVRTLTDEKGEAWFVGVDVARALGYKNPSNTLNIHVDLDDRKCQIISQDTRNRYVYRNPKIVIINESGLYSLVLSSKLPQARKFKHWVTSELLPQIRKTGGYIPVAEEDDEQTILAKALLIAKQTIEAQSQLEE